MSNDPSHSQIESITESTALILESALQSVNMIVSNVNLQKLTGDQRVQLQGWHDGLKQACKVIREPA